MIDGRLWVFGEIETTPIAGRKALRYAVVYDPSASRIVATELLWTGDAKAAFRHRTGTVGVFELTVEQRGERKVIWRREATSWRP